MIGFKLASRISLVIIVMVLIIAVPALVSETQSTLDLPSVERRSLLNGMQFLFFDGKPEEAPFLLMVKNGAAFDPKDKWGATNVMVHMLLDTLNDEQTKAEFSAQGIDLRCVVDWDAIFIYGTSREDSIEFALSRLADAIVRPELTEDSLTRVKQRIQNLLQNRVQQVDYVTEGLFAEVLFSGNPYSHPVEGSLEDLAGVDLRDVKIQYRRLILPNQALLALHFDGDREDLFRRLGRRWGSWVQSDPAPFTFRKSVLPETPQIRLLNREVETGYLRWGYLGVPRKSTDFLALKILEQYLTLSLPDWAQDVAASSQIRGQAKLVAGRMPGYIQVSIQCPVDSLRDYYDKINDSLEAVRQGSLDLKRFEEAKQLVMYEYASQLENPLDKVRSFLEADLFGLGVSYITTFSLRLERITPDVFQRKIGEILPQRKYTLILAGPREKLSPIFAELGNIQVLN